MLEKLKKMKPDDGFTLIEMIIAMGVLLVLVGAGLFAYPQMQEWTKKSELDVVTGWAYESGLNALTNPWSGLSVPEAIEQASTGHADVEITYAGDANTDFCVTGIIRMPNGEELVKHKGACGQSNGDGPGDGDGDGGGTVIVGDNTTEFIYQCDFNVSGYPLPVLGLSPSAIVYYTGSDGSYGLIPVGSDGQTIASSTPATAGVRYTVTITGEYEIFGAGPEGFNQITSCMREITKIGEYSGVTGLNRIGGMNLTVVPDNIPSTVTSLENAFNSAISFNHPNVVSWDVTNVISMKATFKGAQIFNQPIGDWDTKNVLDMSSVLTSARDFNQNLDNWDTSNVRTLEGAFAVARNFNNGLPPGVSGVMHWETGRVTNLKGIFSTASSFNQNVNSWATHRVFDMGSAFTTATVFNQPLNNWNTMMAREMSYMFNGARAFNQPIGNWNTQNVTSMSGMFIDTPNFNQNISNWNVNLVTAENRADFALLSALTAANQPKWK